MPMPVSSQLDSMWVRGALTRDATVESDDELGLWRLAWCVGAIACLVVDLQKDPGPVLAKRQRERRPEFAAGEALLVVGIERDRERLALPVNKR